MQQKPPLDVVGIGNAIVDVLSPCEEEKLTELGLTKGSMTLIDEAMAEQLYNNMGGATECSGGSAANTLAGLAGLGGRCAFIGKVKDDQLGEIFGHDMRAAGVDFSTHASADGPATARCLIFVTPDAQRTMATYLGACGNVTEEDIDEQLVTEGSILYVEGYLWDPAHAKAAIRHACDIAKKAGKKVAFTLSDTFCVKRHRAEFLELLGGTVDILFANEHELLALFDTDDFDSACKKLRGRCEIAAITCSERGCVILTRDKTLPVSAEKVEHVVDTTGAGDLFASGFLYGVARSWELEKAAKLGNRCAAVIIQQMGARSMRPLAPLLAA